ncbi:sensor histidine kinase [Planomonospora sphaerica]|nr:HAMP domain-containing sensor histidine kinase [Planomonospora sphaerica]
MGGSMLNSGGRLDHTASHPADDASGAVDDVDDVAAVDTTRAILGLLDERLRGSDDAGGANADATLLAGIRSVPGVLSAELRPADATPPADGERLWPAGPGRMLAVTLAAGFEDHGVPEALSCLAATLDASWRRDAETRSGGPSDAATLAAAKTEFISTVVHDLATPITPILAYAGLLADPETGPLTGDQSEFVKVIERNAMRLSELLNDLPLLADPATTEPELRPERIDPMEMVRDIVAQFRPGALHAGVSLRYHARPGPALSCNTVRVRRMLDILLTAAITRAGPGDAVEVELRPTVDGWRVEIGCVAADGEASLTDQAGRGEDPAGEKAWPRLGMARAIAGMHGGTLQLIENGTRRSEVRVELPWEPVRDRREER